MESRVIAAIAVISAFALVGGASVIVLTNTTDTDGRPVIYTSMHWQKEMVQEIAGDGYKVVSFIGPGKSPHIAEGDAVKAAEASKAMAYFYIGAAGAGLDWEQTYIDALAGTSVRNCGCVVGSGITIMAGGCEHDHDDDAPETGGAHDHGSKDGHVWSSPKNLGLMAKYVRDELTKMAPENAEKFEEGYKRYVAETDSLVTLANEKLNKTEYVGEEIVVGHGAWAYLLTEYRIKQHSLDGAAGTGTTALVAELKEHNDDDDPFTIFLGAEGQYKITQAFLSENGINARIVYLNPLADNWLSELRKAITEIGNGLAQS